MNTTRPLRPRLARRTGQAGLTLVELMVGLTLALLIVGAGVASLIVARQGYNSVDSTTQLREGARFAAGMIERVITEAGFENVAYGVITNPKDPGVRGYNNALVTGTLPGSLVHANRTAGNCGSATGTTCMNGSDVLVVRFWGVSRNGVADGTMVNCAGIPEPEGNVANSESRAYSIFHVATSSTGEPTLACTYRDPTSGTFTTVPLVQGVEGFQVLYGTQGVTIGACSSAPTELDKAADRYLTANELDPGGVYCANNWARVRSIRIGLLVRGAVGTASFATTPSFDVLGDGFDDNTRDLGSVLTVAADRRLRQTAVFTVHLRNPQYSP